MTQGWESIELKVFRQHSSSFADAISEVTPMADKLHEKSLIDIAEEAREAYGEDLSLRILLFSGFQ